MLIDMKYVAMRSGVYDPLSTVGKIISRGSRGSTEGEAQGTSEASKGNNFSRCESFLATQFIASGEQHLSSLLASR